VCAGEGQKLKALFSMPSRFVRAAAALWQQRRRRSDAWCGDKGVPNATRRDVWSACLHNHISHKSMRNSSSRTPQLGRVRIPIRRRRRHPEQDSRSPAAIYIHSRTCSLACTGGQPYRQLHHDPSLEDNHSPTLAINTESRRVYTLRQQP
jgi:hypothetical protein